MMEAEKNNKKSYPVGPANPSITIGKGKEESYSWSLSSQDVFSDSGNASGNSQKTSLPSDIERGKRAQLEEDFNKKSQKKNENSLSSPAQKQITIILYQRGFKKGKMVKEEA